MAYVYKGKQTIVPAPAVAKPKTLPPLRPSQRKVPLKPCGTTAAYKRHLIAKEIACGPCLEANRTYAREYDRRTNKRARHVLAPCGTPSAYQRHRRNGEPTCQPCRDAHNNWQQANKARKKAEKQ